MEEKETFGKLLDQLTPFDIRPEEHMLKRYFKFLINLTTSSFWCLFYLAGALMPLGVLFLIGGILWSILITIF